MFRKCSPYILTTFFLVAAERIGVNAEPEISVRRIEPNVEFLVIASDGVFEFMSSQKVVDMVRSQSLMFANVNISGKLDLIPFPS